MLVLAGGPTFVVGCPKFRGPGNQHPVKLGIETNRVNLSPEKQEGTRTLVGCGQNMSDQTIRIVDVETQTPCAADQIGEIWVSGPSVASGYWNKPLETEATFSARLPDCPEAPFLRTGDLGFIHEGELYITGRLKNLIISDGKNHYAQDIERTVENAHPAVLMAGSAFFSINDMESERVIDLAEMASKLAIVV